MRDTLGSEMLKSLQHLAFCFVFLLLCVTGVSVCVWGLFGGKEPQLGVSVRLRSAVLQESSVEHQLTIQSRLALPLHLAGITHCRIHQNRPSLNNFILIKEIKQVFGYLVLVIAT